MWRRTWWWSRSRGLWWRRGRLHAERDGAFISRHSNVLLLYVQFKENASSEFDLLACNMCRATDLVTVLGGLLGFVAAAWMYWYSSVKKTNVTNIYTYSNFADSHIWTNFWMWSEVKWKLLSTSVFPSKRLDSTHQELKNINNYSYSWTETRLNLFKCF